MAEYSHKIPVPDDSRFYGVNIHSSLLPEGRSYYPIECAMERGLGRSGVTMHKIAKSLDRGISWPKGSMTYSRVMTAWIFI
ncbi:MAG: formyltransferase family protein [Enterocloster bolteae]